MRYNLFSKFAVGAAVLLTASGAWAQGGGAAAPFKVGVLNVRGAIVATAEGKQASAQMQSQFAAQQTELQNLQNQIQELQTRLANGARTLSDEEKARLQRQGQYLVSQSQRKQDDLNEAVNLAQTDIMESIGGKLSDIVDKYGRDNNFSVILDSSAQGTPVVYNAMALDVTADIVRLYDEAHPVKGPMPAAAPTSAPGTSATPRPAMPSAAPGRGSSAPGAGR